jgi:DNA-binding response OmpR family regulator
VGTATILVVEDNSLVLAMVRTTLTHFGYQVHGAGHPQEALAFDAAHPGAIDLLLTDVVLPSMDGHELYQRLAVHTPRLLVLYISGYDADTARAHGVEVTAANFLAKPFSATALADKVREVLAGPRDP